MPGENEMTFQLVVHTVAELGGLQQVRQGINEQTAATDKATAAIRQQTAAERELTQGTRELLRLQREQNEALDKQRATEALIASTKKAAATSAPASSGGFWQAQPTDSPEYQAGLARQRETNRQMMAEYNAKNPILAPGRAQAPEASIEDFIGLPGASTASLPKRDRIAEIIDGHKQRGTFNRVAEGPEDISQALAALQKTGGEVAAVEAGVAGLLPMLGAAAVAVGGLAAGWLGLNVVWDHWKEKNDKLVPALQNTKTAMGNLLGDVVDYWAGRGEWLVTVLDKITAALGGETEAMKAQHGPLQGLIALHSKAKDATEKWEEKEARLKDALDATRQSLSDYHDEMSQVDNLRLSDAEREHAEEIKRINEDEAASAEEKAARIIEADNRAADNKARLADDERARQIDKARADQQALEDQRAQDLVEFESQKERIQAINKAALAKDAEEKASRDAKTAAKKLEGRDGKDVSVSSEGGGASTFTDDTYEADKADAAKAKAEYESKKKQREEAYKAVPGGVDNLDPAKEKEALEAMREKLRASDSATLAGRRHLASKEHQADTQKLGDDLAVLDREKALNEANEKARQAAQEKAQKEREQLLNEVFPDSAGAASAEVAPSGKTAPKQAGESGPSSAGSGGGDGTGNNRDLLKEIADNTSRIGGGGDGTSGGGDGGGNGDDDGGSNGHHNSGKGKHYGSRSKFVGNDDGEVFNARGGQHAGERIKGPKPSGRVGSSDGIVTGRHGGRRRPAYNTGGGGGGGDNQTIDQEDLDPDELAARRARILNMAGAAGGPTADLKRVSAESLNPDAQVNLGGMRNDPDYLRRKNAYEAAKTAEKSAAAANQENRFASTAATGGGMGAATGGNPVADAFGKHLEKFGQVINDLGHVAGLLKTSADTIHHVNQGQVRANQTQLFALSHMSSVVEQNADTIAGVRRRLRGMNPG